MVLLIPPLCTSPFLSFPFLLPSLGASASTAVTSLHMHHPNCTVLTTCILLLPCPETWTFSSTHFVLLPLGPFFAFAVTHLTQPGLIGTDQSFLFCPLSNKDKDSLAQPLRQCRTTTPPLRLLETSLATRPWLRRPRETKRQAITSSLLSRACCSSTSSVSTKTPLLSTGTRLPFTPTSRTPPLPR